MKRMVRRKTHLLLFVLFAVSQVTSLNVSEKKNGTSSSKGNASGTTVSPSVGGQNKKPSVPQIVEKLGVSNETLTAALTPKESHDKPEETSESERVKPVENEEQPHSETQNAEEESLRIQDILRQIFHDELEDGGDEEEDEFEEREDLSRMGPIEEIDRSAVNSRKGRARAEEEDMEDDESEAEMIHRAGAIKPKGAKGQVNPNKDPTKGVKGQKHGGSPGLKNNNGKPVGGPGGKGNKQGGKGGKTTDLVKYNNYMDAVLKRMNSLIRSKRMDPLRVNLYASPSNEQSEEEKTKSPGGKKKNKGKRTHGNNKARQNPEDDDEGEGPVHNVNVKARRHIRSALANLTRPMALNERLRVNKRPFVGENDDPEHSRHDLTEDDSLDEETKITPSSTEKDEEEDRAGLRAGSKKEKKGKKGEKAEGNVTVTKPPNSGKKPGGPGGPKGNASTKGNPNSKGQGNNKNNNGNKGNPNAKNKKQNKQKQQEQQQEGGGSQGPRPTRGILHGLSTLKRDGNVNVVRQGDKVRIVRARFFLGPVALEILPKKGKVGGKEGTGATATAPQLRGILEVRLKQKSPTRIRKLRVFPPKKVSVAGDTRSPGLKGKGKSYGKVTPMATARLRQVANQVVRFADNIKTEKGNGPRP